MGEVRQDGNHFVTGTFTPRAAFIDPEIYGLMVRDNVVRGCVDCLVVNSRGMILLGGRSILPWPSWWTFGGRMVPGESPQQACVRNTKRDLGLEIAPERFVYLDVLSLVFGRRNEPPQENGCHDLVLFHFLEISDKEYDAIKLGTKEYSGILMATKEDILDHPSCYHPAIVQIVTLAENRGLLKEGS